MKYTRRSFIRMHRTLWKWLAETGKEKEDWPRWKYNGGDIKSVNSRCFACVSNYLGYSGCDENCLFIWRNGHCYRYRSEYMLWKYAKTIKRKKYWAKRIANLKVRRIRK